MEWISVEDRLPDCDPTSCVDVLAYIPSQIVILTYFPALEEDDTDNRFYYTAHNKMNEVTRVTHWMPLPKEPK